MNNLVKLLLLTLIYSIMLPTTAMADAKYDALRKKVELLENQLKQIKNILKEQNAKVNKVEKLANRKKIIVKGVKGEVVVRSDAKKLEEKVNVASEWKDPNTLVHMSG